MQLDNRDTAYLWDMLRAARLIQEFTQGVYYSRYEADQMLQSAVERQLEIIGEAARRIPIQFQKSHPEIPWRQITGLRNILIHEYGEVKADRIWLIIQDNIGELITLLEPLIPPTSNE